MINVLESVIEHRAIASWLAAVLIQWNVDGKLSNGSSASHNSQGSSGSLMCILLMLYIVDPGKKELIAFRQSSSSPISGKVVLLVASVKKVRMSEIA